MISVYEKEEEQLKNMYDNVQVPLDSLDEAIFAGFQKAKSEAKRKSRRKRWVFTLAAAAIILLGFFTSIRLSPAFANYITVIPGMEKLVDLIRDDKGKLLAVENDYYEKIGVSQEKNGIKLTLDGAIADENGLVLFYTLETKAKLEALQNKSVRLESLDGKKLDIGSISMGSSLYKGETTNSDMFEFYFQSPLAAKELELKVSVEGTNLKEEFTLKFNLTKEIQKKKSYTLNKTVTIEGQKIKFLNADVYPLRAAVHVKMDPKNTKRILSFEDLRLVDENGETWNKISNGTVSSNISPDEFILYLQSNYFQEPKKLYLVLNKLQAIDKDEVNVVVDPKKLQILKQPKGGHLSDLRVADNYLIFNFHTEKEFHYFLFSEIKDGNGERIESGSSYKSEGNEQRDAEIGVYIPDLEKQAGPISLELTAYPSWIKGNEKIKIK
ncbi:DUF4179 domain-containing protein [Neobacillus novalis]|uniref:DUF4179 domain-containing protein n=1 Tax=Neobacillus novalis TaxID=220687 RepID=A0AA95MP10_9BACI|nr:DUF4179 domain-containing protein [Neobacillus novalis]WHY87271.1 DUF4179 domain-containing protein [Neobacillus novalis]